MAHYILLLRYTDQGIRNIKDTTKRAAAFQEMAEKMGAKVQSILWTMGQYDLVSHVEAPNDETASALSVGVGKLGNVSIQTLRAFTAAEVEGIIKKAG
jgi:uncharacterized protein with GYD domain